MELMTLGTGTGIPLPHRSSPCLVLLAGQKTVLFDMGPGSLRQFASAGLDFRKIDQVFLTHFHPDHCSDLVHFLFATRNPAVLGDRAPFRIVGPRGLKDFLACLQKAHGGWLDLPGGLMQVEERDREKRQTRSYETFDVVSQPVLHTERSLAYRVDLPEGKRFVYSGDTGFCDEIVTLARDADALILECSLPEGTTVEGHLTPSGAGRIATLSGARRLILLHFYPEVLSTDIPGQCRRTYSGELTLASDLMTITL